jgi:oligo-1,6-glucosidase
MKPFTLKSKVRDVYASPVGRDVIDKLLLQLGLSDKLVKNPYTMSLTLSALCALTKKRVGADFWDAILDLLNNVQINVLNSTPNGAGTQTPPQPSIPGAKMPVGAADAARWWKEGGFYQIYPRSFCDTNGDGVGDLPGIISKLDYLKELGVDALWLSPIYDSPQDDNGYDIRDYYAIDKLFGTMEDFDTLLSETHARGMRLIMDLVVNHTSDEHEWFRQAVSDPGSKYRDYYHIRSSPGGVPPNNWNSFFSGPAWKRLDGTDDWALCLFSKKQMDLNWDNPETRQDVYKMIRWWLDKGVDGFRLDVINLISKTPGLPDGNEFIGNLMGIRGIERYFYGPNLHDYLREMRREAFEPYNAFTVGETPGVGAETGKLLTAAHRRELDMIFSFDHLEMPGKSRFDEYTYDAAFLKTHYARWMENYGSECWTSLFYDNHDNPRMLSKIDPKGKRRVRLAKLLAVIQLTLRGTPFLYQGQELGAVNAGFQSIDELRDVESLNLYHELIQTMPEADAFRKVLSGTRDHARVLMRWDGSEEENSVLSFYKRLTKLRKSSTSLVYGKIEIARTAKDIFAYTREDGDEAFYIECNLSPETRSRPANRPDGKLILSNYPAAEKRMRAYEANIYRLRY